jgi:integrase
LLEFVNRYLDSVKAKKLSKKSYKEKNLVFKRLFTEISPLTPVALVTYGMIEKHLDQISNKISGHRANKTRVHIVRAYNWGIKALQLPYPNPWLVEKYREEPKQRYMPTNEDFWEVYKVAKRPEKVILLCAYYLAARKNEILKLKWEDIDFEKRIVRLWTNKRTGGVEYDWLPMESDLYNVLKLYKEETGAIDGHVLINPKTNTRYTWLSKMMPRLCKKAKIKPFGLHGIRHLAACLLDCSSDQFATIQYRMRHKLASTTSKYLRSLRGLNSTEAMTQHRLVDENEL